MRPVNEIYPHAMNSISPKSHRRLTVVFCLLMLVGALAFITGILGPHPQRAWQTYLVNFVFWTGLCFGSVLFSAILTITNARWGRPLKRLAEAAAAFLPVSFVLFWIIFLGRKEIFHWIHEPIPEKVAWLNVPFLFARDAAGLLALTILSMAIVYFSVKRDMDSAAGYTAKLQLDGDGRDWYERILVVLSPLYGILYALVLSLIAFDLIMSLSPHWYSTLFGAAYFVGSLYTALAALMIFAGIAVKGLNLGRYIHPHQFHNLGKLILGFCLMTGDFFFTQFFVIWYGNLPEETRYVILRTRSVTWEPLAWTVLSVCFALPFVVLLNRGIKMKPVAMMILSAVILAGMWLERFLLVAPSIWHGQSLPLGMSEILISAGFIGTIALCILTFMQRFPILPVADPLFREYLTTTTDRNQWRPEAGVAG